MKNDSDNNSGHYIHRITYNYRERVVGFFVVSTFAIFLFLILISGKSEHLFEKRIPYYIDVNSSEGISRGSIVKALGTEVGEVADLHMLKGRKIRITIEIYQGRQSFVRQGAHAVVNRLANISNALIEIESEQINEPVLTAGSIIPVEETPSLNDLLLALASLIQAADNNKLVTKFESILPKLEVTIENIHNIISQISTGHGTLGAAVFDQQVEKNLRTIVKSGAEILLEAEGIITVAKRRLRQIQPLIDDAGYVTKDIRIAAQDLPAMVAELNQIISQTQTAMTLINSELATLPGTVIQTRKTLSKAGHLLDSVQNTWPLSTDVKQPVSDSLIPVHSSHE